VERTLLPYRIGSGSFGSETAPQRFSSLFGSGFVDRLKEVVQPNAINPISNTPNIALRNFGSNHALSVFSVAICLEIFN